MPKVRVALFALCSTSLLALSPVASAQTPPPTSDSSTTSTTVDPNAPSTSTTVDPNASSTSTTVDPAGDADAPSDTVPPDSITVPPRPEEPAAAQLTPEQQAAAAAELGRAVRVTVRTARAAALRAQATFESAVALRGQLEASIAGLQRELGRLHVKKLAAVRELQLARALLEQRAVSAYIRGGDGPEISAVVGSANASDYFQRVTLMQTVLETDNDVVDRFVEAKEKVGTEQLEVVATLRAAQEQLVSVRQQEADARVEAESAAFALAVSSEGGSVVIHGFTFPVARDYAYGDSFGAPRMLGTEYAHFHEGTDIMAPAGTELLCAERGIVTRMGTDVLGGIKVWLKGESGTYYYYAHLSSYAPGLVERAVCDAGAVIGYVGDTGNAKGGAPHLHFEVHPDGGAAINPYPLLKVAEARTKARAAAAVPGAATGPQPTISSAPAG